MRRLLVLALAACGSHGHTAEPHPAAPDAGATESPDASTPAPDAEVAAAPPDAAPAPAALPDATMSVAKPKITGDVAADTARARLREHVNELLPCYQRELALHSDLAGKVDAYITIDDSGTVTNADITGLDSSVDTCLASVIDTIEFPKPKKTSKAIIDATLTFAPK